MLKDKKFLVMIVVIAMFSSAVLLSGCTEEKKGNKIIVGTSADFPPFEYVEGGKIVGFDIELITTILENLNYTVEVKDIAFESLIQSLKSDKIDVIAAGMTINDVRDEEIDFSDPYYKADQSMLIKKDSGVEINSSLDLENFTASIANLTIGVQLGTTGEDWVKEKLIKTGMMDDYNGYELYIDAIADLDIGRDRLDAIILDLPVAQAFAENPNREVVYTIITDEYYGFGVKEGNSDLQEKINAELENLDTEYWDSLINKYFDVDTV
jgi:polar amino acid transport system substrate-binding protein